MAFNWGGAGSGAASGASAGSAFGPWGAAAGGVIGGLAGGFLSRNKNPSKEAGKYFDQIPDELRKYFDPYINAGNRALPGLEREYGRLIGDPGARMNEIGADYQQSPGFQFALKNALQSAGHAAAAGGMAGSPQHEQQSMEVATGLANQDYNQWLQQALGLYGRGLSGEENIYGIGAKAGMGMGENMASYLANRAKLEYEGANAENQQSGGAFGGFGSAFSSFGDAYKNRNKGM